MILRLVFDNPISAKDLQQAVSGCCPNRCPSVEVEPNLARFVAAWPQLSSADKNAIARFAVLATGSWIAPSQ